MNGRVYDPVLGRFLSADPHVDGAGDPQGFNRYSYVGNNPLNATDPSGYFKLKDLFGVNGFFMMPHYMNLGYWLTPGFYRQTAGQAMGIAAGVIVTVFTGSPTLAAAAAGFVTGFNNSLLNGGSVGDAFRSGLIGAGIAVVTAYASAQIGEALGHTYPKYGVPGEIGRAAAHGAVGGAIEAAQGGDFRHGFAAGAIGSAAGSVVGSSPLQQIDGGQGIAIRTAIVAMAGGTASEISGGKFANGALTSAFQHIYNAEAQRWRYENQADARVALAFADVKDPGGIIMNPKTSMGEGWSAGGERFLAGAQARSDNVVRVNSEADIVAYFRVHPEKVASIGFFGHGGQKNVFINRVPVSDRVIRLFATHTIQTGNVYFFACNAASVVQNYTQYFEKTQTVWASIFNISVSPQGKLTNENQSTLLMYGFPGKR